MFNLVYRHSWTRHQKRHLWRVPSEQGASSRSPFSFPWFWRKAAWYINRFKCFFTIWFAISWCSWKSTFSAPTSLTETARLRARVTRRIPTHQKEAFTISDTLWRDLRFESRAQIHKTSLLHLMRPWDVLGCRRCLGFLLAAFVCESSLLQRFIDAARRNGSWTSRCDVTVGGQRRRRRGRFHNVGGVERTCFGKYEPA